MKIWIVKFPYDYHEEAEYLIRAETKEDALEKVKNLPRYHEEVDSLYPNKTIKAAVILDNVKEWKGNVYFNQGCDC